MLSVPDPWTTVFLFRLRDDSQVWLRRLPASRILLLRFLVRNGWQNDDIAALLPVHRGRDFVFGGELHRIENPQYLVEITAGAHGIDKHQLDLLVGADDEHRAHGRVVCGSAALLSASALGGQHAVELGNLQFGIADHWIVDFVALGLLDVSSPLAVIGYGIDAEPNDFRVPLGKFGLESGHVSEFGGADWREVFRM